MKSLARMVVLDLRTTAPYRWQALLLFGICVAMLAGNRPVVIVPALVLLLTSQFAAYPFQVGDKAGLDTLYAVLPVTRRAVLCGHYAWAMTCFAATAVLGTAVTLLAGSVKSQPIGARELLTTLTLAWAIFVLNVSIQFPLFIRFGYSRISLMSTFLPIAVIMVALTRMHLSIVSFATLQRWLPLIWMAGAAVIGASMAVAVSGGGRWRFAAPAPG